MPALSVLMSSLRVVLLLIHSTYLVTAASAAPSVTIEQHGRTVTVESFARKFHFILSQIVRKKKKKTTTKHFVEIGNNVASL